MQHRRRTGSCALVATLAAVLAPATLARAQEVGRTEPLAAMVGNYATNPAQLYGTDLGWSFKHGKHLWMLFGDSWKGPSNGETYLGDLADFLYAGDDALGFITLEGDFETGASTEAFVRAAARGPKAFPWSIAPKLVEAVSPNGARPITLLRDGDVLKNRPLGPGLTPVTGFSNGRSDATAGAFGIFFRNEPVKCSEGCGVFTCKPELNGRCVAKGQPNPTPVSAPCVPGKTPQHDQCWECREIAGSGGFCVDPNSSMYDETPRGLASSIAVVQEVGCATDSNNLNRSEPSRIFDTRAWNTHRFFNAMARTVDDFDAARSNGIGNDYRTADGADPAREGVFVWGRPHFGGWVKENRDAQLYLAWVPMPAYAPDGRMAWDPSYFAGLDAQGRPQFVKDETKSVALPLNGPRDGGTSEVIDVVGQMTISFIPEFNRWVMIYGGGLSYQFGSLIFGEDWKGVENAGTNSGPLYIRTAAQPWGPWSAPRPLLDPGDANAGDRLYDSDGLLYSPNCRGNCVQTEAQWNNPGGLYAPNIIEPWTIEHDGEVDLYWNMSTWNPYEVILMKTTLSAPDVR